MLYSAALERQQQQGQNDMGMATAAKKKGLENRAPAVASPSFSRSNNNIYISRLGDAAAASLILVVLSLS